MYTAVKTWTLSKAPDRVQIMLHNETDADVILFTADNAAICDLMSQHALTNARSDKASATLACEAYPDGSHPIRL